MQGKRSTGKVRLLYLIFSVIVAISLWTYVTYVGNPVLTSPVARTNVPVEFINEEYLRDYNLIVTDVDVRQLTVYFGGRYRDITKINDMDVRAVVDLEDVLQYTSPTGTHSLEYDLEYEGSNSITVERTSRSVIEVTVDRQVTDTFELTPVYEGKFADGYMAGELTLSRNTVDISGTEAAISQIASAKVTLKRDNLSQTATDSMPIKLYDEDGNELDMSALGLTFANSDGTAVITQSVMMVKEVPLVVDIVESLTATDANVNIGIEPQTVTLSGDPEVLESLNNVNLGTVDLKSFTMNYEQTFQIRIPNNVNNLSSVSTATVRIDVLGMSTKRLSASNITYRNEAENDSVSIITQTLDITLRGSESDLDQVAAENIRIVADLSGYDGSSNTYEAPARVYVDGFPNVEAVNDYKVFVTISRS